MVVNAIQSSFGGAVRCARIKLWLSQEELADCCGLDRSYIGGIERGERNPSVTVISRIAGGLKISVSDLFVGVSGDRNDPHRP